MGTYHFNNNKPKTEPTTEHNIHSKLRHVEFLLDTIEDGLDNNTNNKQQNYTNVISILPNIKHEWNQIRDSDTMTLFELIDYCELWTIELASLANYNIGNPNKRLIAHLRDGIEICRSVVLVTHQYMHTNM